MKPLSEFNGKEKTGQEDGKRHVRGKKMNLLEIMHKNLEPLKVTFTWMWLVPWPDKKKARKRFMSKPLRSVRKAVIYGKLKTMRIICLK